MLKQNFRKAKDMPTRRIIFVLGALLLFSCLAWPCDCRWIKYENEKPVSIPEPPLTLSDIVEYPLIFSGMPIRMELDYGIGKNPNEISLNGKKVTFMVFKVWKGQEAKEITIHTGLGGGDCGFRFELGDNYLVFPKSQEGNALPEVDTCNRTKRMHDAVDNLAVLREYQDKATSTPK